MSNPLVAHTGDSSGDVRSLPPKPSLEYERKQAKALLRRLRDGDPDALNRARSRHSRFRNSSPDAPTLADAQLIIAREYGFSSWPRLVQYFATLQRETAANRSVNGFEQDRYDRRVQALLTEHARGRSSVGRTFASFVPRFYGQSIAEVIASPVTIEDARLVVARQQHCSSWEHLVEYASEQRSKFDDAWKRESEPQMRAIRAMHAHDLAALQNVVRDHPEVLEQSDEDRRTGYTLLSSALAVELQGRRPDATALTDWLATQGLDLATTLNHALIRFRPSTSDVQALLNRGADPRWIAPNGMSILEHAILMYWNGEAVDLIARRSTPRRALWIAAGVGDVAGVRRFFDRQGKLTLAAYRDRPPLEMIFLHGMPTLPEPDELEVLAEAALVATLNDRADVLALLIDRGYPVDHRWWEDVPLIYVAIQYQMESVVELLVSRGAALDVELEQTHSARSLARVMLENHPDTARMRRIAALCGLDADHIRSEVEAEPPRELGMVPGIPRALKLASDDAIRGGHDEIRPDSLFVGVLSPLNEEFLLRPFAASGVDLLKLREMLRHRIFPTEAISREDLTLDADARGVMDRAKAIATARRDDALTALHVARALLDNEVGFAAEALISAGADLSKLRAELERAYH